MLCCVRRETPSRAERKGVPLVGQEDMKASCCTSQFKCRAAKTPRRLPHRHIKSTPPSHHPLLREMATPSRTERKAPGWEGRLRLDRETESTFCCTSQFKCRTVASQKRLDRQPPQVRGFGGETCSSQFEGGRMRLLHYEEAGVLSGPTIKRLNG
jgi:hypothetical protein